MAKKIVLSIMLLLYLAVALTVLAIVFDLTPFAPSPTNGLLPATEAQIAELKEALKRSNDAQINAFKSLDAAALRTTFTGVALEEQLVLLETVRAQGTYELNTLVSETYQSFAVSPDGQRAEVKVAKTWSVETYDKKDNTCRSKLGGLERDQTILLERQEGTWRITQIIYTKQTPGEVLTCP